MILPLPKQGQLLSSSCLSQHPSILSYNFSKPKRKMKAAFIFSLWLQLNGLACKILSQYQKEKVHVKWFSNYSLKLVLQAQEHFLVNDCYFSFPHLFFKNLRTVLTIFLLFFLIAIILNKQLF